MCLLKDLFDKMVAPGFAQGALAFSERCSTYWATRPIESYPKVLKQWILIFINNKNIKAFGNGWDRTNDGDVMSDPFYPWITLPFLLGRKESNLRIAGSKPAAFPLGYVPNSIEEAGFEPTDVWFTVRCVKTTSPYLQKF
jgi:hypothetical protein